MKEKEKQMSIKTDKLIEAFTSYLLPFKNKFKKGSKCALLIFTLLFFNIGAKYPVMSDPTPNNVIVNIAETNLKNYPIIVRSRVYNKLVIEVKTYIETMAPTSTINPELLVSMCQKYNLNITFVLAQGLLESHFGTRGRALTTKSIFNVGAWDSGKIIYTYKDVNESIEPYMQLIRNEYLVNKKLLDLIQDRGYKNIDGHRYASSIIYEQSLRTLMANIDMQTSIKMYQDVMNLTDEEILAYFGPIEETIIPTQLQANLN